MPKENHEEIEKLKMFFEKLPSRKDTPLSKITIQNYVSKLNKLSILVQGRGWDGKPDFLKDAKKVISSIENADITGKKDFLSPVLRLLKYLNSPNDLILQYQKGLSDFKNEEYGKRKKNIATDDNVENSMPYNEILEKIKLYKPIGENSLMYKLICALYFMNFLVPRNDLPYTKLASEKKKLKDLNKDYNYILVSNVGEPTSMIWQKYKSDFTFGARKFPITPYVKNLLKEYIQETGRQNGDLLFKMRTGEEYKKSNFVDVIKRATKEVLGKEMSVDLIRQIQITNFYRDGVKSISEDEKDADRFLHSVKVHKEYYRENLKGSDDEDE